MPTETALREAENNALSSGEQSFYRGNGRPDDDKESKSKKKGGWLNARKKGFAGLILSLALITGGGAFLSSTNSLLGAALNDKLTEVTDMQHAPNSWRSRIILKYMMEGKTVKHTWKGSAKYVKMPKSTIKRLESSGIEVKGSGSNRVFVFNGEEITAANFNNTYRDNVEFRDAYNRARRNRIINFFDDTANKIANKFGLSRNTQKNVHQTEDAEADKKQFNEVMEESTKNTGSGDLETTHAKEEPEYEDDGNGNRVPKTDEDGNPITTVVGEETKESSKATSGDTANAKASAYINKIAGTVQQVTNWGCTAAKLASMISVVVAALDRDNSMHFALPILESSSKMKYGLGSESTINPALNFLNTVAEVEVEDFAGTPKTNKATFDEDFEIELGKVKTNGTPLMSAGLSNGLSDMPVDSNSAQNYSLERGLSVLGSRITATAQTFKTCAALQAGTALVSIAVTVATGGLSFLGSYVLRAVGGVALNAAFGTFLGFLIPTIAQSLFTNITEYALGIPGGEITMRGLMAYNGQQAISGSSLAPSSADRIAAHNKLNNQIIALDAETERYNRSPFDITSRHTFLGSIAYKFATTTSSTKISGKIKNLMSLTSSSIASATGNVMASGEQTYPTIHGNCPFLNSDDMYNAEGDMYCNVMPAFDLSTIELEADDDTYATILAQNTDNDKCDDDGNCPIKKNSDLAKYITYCDGRESPWGAVDANILNSLKSLGNGGDLIVSFLGSLPLVGDAVDIIDAAADMDNLRWATGAKCVNSPNNPDWGTFKYFQLYVADQRILTQMGAYEGSQSPVAAYLEEYETENPVDNSPSGYLARISGLTKNDAQLVMDVAYYYNFLDNYDASTRIAMNGTASDIMSGEEVAAKLDYEFRYKDFEKNFESDNYTSKAIIAEHIIYADVRNRSHAA